MGAHDHHDMGHTVAGWTGTAIAVLGTTATGLALIAGSTAGLIAGAALTALGGLAAWLLHLAGWGKRSGPRPPHARHWRHRDTAARAGHPGCLGCRLAGRTPAAPTPAPARAPRVTDLPGAPAPAPADRPTPTGEPAPTPATVTG
ncbi:HGxxPAAW family protein [Kitasatospora sp. NPDC048365]|uniref:HGxxPAAW family protein n=1 Tax=Kitasatospora sp. NPDC048365 TaxID=3364050 RepID=UPI00371D3432